MYCYIVVIFRLNFQRRLKRAVKYTTQYYINRRLSAVRNNT